MLIRLAAVLVALAVVCGLFVGGTAVARQETPQPESEGGILVGIEGVEDAAVRDYESSGLRLVGSIGFSFWTVRFDSQEAASAAVPKLVDGYLAFLADDGGDPRGVRPTSVRPLAEEAVAYSGEVLATEEDGIGGTVALLIVRDGTILYFMVGAALAGDPLTDLAGVAETIIGREPGDQATPVAADGLRTGGLWDLLPRLADLPEGFVLDEERVPAPFAPLPGQGTPEP